MANSMNVGTLRGIPYEDFMARRYQVADDINIWMSFWRKQISGIDNPKTCLKAITSATWSWPRRAYAAYTLTKILQKEYNQNCQVIINKAEPSHRGWKPDGVWHGEPPHNS